MMRWFRRHMRHAFLEDYGQAEQTLRRMRDDIRTARGQLYSLYEEVELAIRALDTLGERVEAARSRVLQRLSQGETLTPETFTATRRQRESALPTSVAVLLLVLLCQPGQAADVVSGGFKRRITTTVESISFPIAARSVGICNNGSVTVYVDFDGTGQAGPGRSTSHLVEPGKCKVIPFIAGRERNSMAAVTETGESNIVVDVAQE